MKGVKVNDIKVVPDITKNIISIGLLLRDGGVMDGDNESIKIKYKGTNSNVQVMMTCIIFMLHDYTQIIMEMNTTYTKLKE